MAEHDDSTAPRPWADAAVDHVLRRLARAPEPPWLHGEIAQVLRHAGAAAVDVWVVARTPAPADGD